MACGTEELKDKFFPHEGFYKYLKIDTEVFSSGYHGELDKESRKVLIKNLEVNSQDNA